MYLPEYAGSILTNFLLPIMRIILYIRIYLTKVYFI
nr:MAG TPA: hypothetical protein [Caudoviricetes sp.]